jgi:predicted PurR-regulated permease PerM
VQVEKPRFDVKSYLWTGTLGFAALLGQITLVCVLTCFLLASGDGFRRKLVTIAGPTFARKRVTVQALDEITAQIQRFLVVNLFTGLLVGVATGLAFLWIGLEHAAVWGVAAGLLNLVPYVGPVAVTAVAALMGYVQFGSMEMAIRIAGASILINSIEGYLLTPWLTSRASRINPAIVFVGVLLWGWLWGVWGLLLGVPILVALKAVCDHVDDLKPIGELLGD